MDEAEVIFVDHRKARDWTLKLMGKVGLPAEDAELFVDALIQADLRGIDSHGLYFLPLYVKRLELGLIAKRGRIRIIREGPAFALVDGGNILGHVAAYRAMEMAIVKARQVGVGMVGVQNSNHSGIMARYTLMAAESGCIGITITNTPPLMAPWGGVKAFFGTNPISIAVPGGKEPPLVLDMATSEVARFKILLASRKGEKIPSHWALDEHGLPTDEPHAALKGTMAPMSRYKGFGLAMMIDILSGVLTGAASGPEVGDLFSFETSEKQNVGHYFQAIHIDHLVPIQEFEQRIDRLIRQLRSAPRVPGVDKIHLPGDGGRETEQKRREQGIPLSPDVQNELGRLGKKYGLTWPD